MLFARTRRNMRPAVKLWILGAVLTTLPGSLRAAPPVAVGPQSYVPGEVVVQFKDGTTDQERDNA